MSKAEEAVPFSFGRTKGLAFVAKPSIHLPNLVGAIGLEYVKGEERWFAWVRIALIST